MEEEEKQYKVFEPDTFKKTSCVYFQGTKCTGIVNTGLRKKRKFKSFGTLLEVWATT